MGNQAVRPGPIVCVMAIFVSMSCDSGQLALRSTDTGGAEGGAGGEGAGGVGATGGAAGNGGLPATGGTGGLECGGDNPDQNGYGYLSVSVDFLEHYGELKFFADG